MAAFKTSPDQKSLAALKKNQTYKTRINKLLTGIYLGYGYEKEERLVCQCNFHINRAKISQLCVWGGVMDFESFFTFVT